MRMDLRLVGGLAMVVACGGGGGGGDGDGDLPDAASHDVVAGDVWEDTARDVPVHVSRDVIRDLGGRTDPSREVLRDIHAGARDVPGTHAEGTRDVPYVHRDTGANVPSRDAHKE